LGLALSTSQTTGELFPPRTSTAFRLVLALAALGFGGALTGLMVFARSPLYTGQHEPVAQPLQFDHRHHVGDLGIDCRYCHLGAETTASAGYPPTEVCMSCHGQIWNQSPLLAPVRESYFTGKPLTWKRVHRLPDFVYFNHSIHVNKGVGCVTCHGRVDQMAAVMQVEPISMKWCIDCHRAPESHLRPQERVTDLAWEPVDPVATGREVAEARAVHTRTSCTTCHR
jgi:Cytochrome c7 and related cytochrome c